MTNGKHIGYVRVSTILQNEDRQLAEQLADQQLDKVFTEKASARDTNGRPVLMEMLEYIRDGDTLYIHDISRLARNIADLHSLVKEINGKGVTIRFMKEGLTFSGEKADPMSDLLLSMLGAVYQFERAIMLERQKEGVALAKAKGKYKGRKKTIDDDEIRALLGEGLSMRKVAKQMGISVATVQRASKKGKESSSQ